MESMPLAGQLGLREDQVATAWACQSKEVTVSDTGQLSLGAVDPA